MNRFETNGLKAPYFQGVETRALSTRGQADVFNHCSICTSPAPLRLYLVRVPSVRDPFKHEGELHSLRGARHVPRVEHQLPSHGVGGCRLRQLETNGLKALYFQERLKALSTRGVKLMSTFAPPNHGLPAAAHASASHAALSPLSSIYRNERGYSQNKIPTMPTTKEASRSRS